MNTRPREAGNLDANPAHGFSSNVTPQALRPPSLCHTESKGPRKPTMLKCSVNKILSLEALCFLEVGKNNCFSTEP